MIEIYNRYQELLSSMRNADGFYDAVEWFHEIKRFEKENNIKSMINNVMTMENGNVHINKMLLN